MLIVDFVPNHTATDHPWVEDHPEYYVHGAAADLAREPHNYRRVLTQNGPRILAHGRDPYFPGWTDTFQLNYRHPGLRHAMESELLTIAEVADGIRADMAMLVLPDVIHRTWGALSEPADGAVPVDASFWPGALGAVRERHPSFRFIGEVYWDREWDLVQQGFDYAYDKRLYDRLRKQDAAGVRAHLNADPDSQKRLARFLENHDEARAAAAFPDGVHQAAAVITYLSPGLKFFHDGQFEGCRKRLPVQLGHRQGEPVDAKLSAFYDRLLPILDRPEIQDGTFRALAPRAAGEGNSTWNQFVALGWVGANGKTLVAVVNFAPNAGQAYLEMPWVGDMPAWQFHVFEVQEAHRSAP